MRSTLVSFALVATGCYPTLPPHLGEGTEVLAPGRVNLAIAGGAGSFEGKDAAGSWVNQVGVGLEARVRTGVGANSEVGASFIGGMGTSVGGGDPPFAIGGKLSYKWGPLPWLAIVADAGAMDFAVASVALFSGDLAIITAPYTWANGMQFYAGAKGAFSIPVLSERDERERGDHHPDRSSHPDEPESPILRRGRTHRRVRAAVGLGRHEQHEQLRRLRDAVADVSVALKHVVCGA